MKFILIRFIPLLQTLQDRSLTPWLPNFVSSYCNNPLSLLCDAQIFMGVGLSIEYSQSTLKEIWLYHTQKFSIIHGSSIRQGSL